MTRNNASEVYAEVMRREPPQSLTPQEEARHSYLFGELWARPELGRRERRWVTLVCVGFDTDQAAMEDQVYAAQQR
jgi:4-carboxymuconolactone decarboxylase